MKQWAHKVVEIQLCNKTSYQTYKYTQYIGLALPQIIVSNVLL